MMGWGRSRIDKDDLYAIDRRIVMAACFAGFLCYFALLPTVPAIIARSGAPFAAASATGVLMAGSIAAQLAVPALMASVSHARLLMFSVLLVGAPAPLYLANQHTGLVLAITAVRGMGFGVLTAVGTALVTGFTYKSRRGAQIGTFGFVTSLAGVLAPPAGLALVVDHQDPLFAATAGVAAVGALLVLIRPPVAVARENRPVRGTAGVRERSKPLLLLLPYAAAYGAVYTLVPLWLPGRAARPLLAFAILFAVLRFVGGYLLDMVGSFPLILTIAVLGPGGAGIVALSLSEVVTIIGAGAMGAACSLAAVVTLVRSVADLRTEHHASVATAWNMVFNIGMGAGSLALAPIATHVGYPEAFVAIAAVLALTGAVFTSVRIAGSESR